MHYVRESPLNYGETNITVYMRGGVNIQVALEASIESHLGFPIALMKCTASEFAACDRNWFFFVSLELYQKDWDSFCPRFNICFDLQHSKMCILLLISSDKTDTQNWHDSINHSATGACQLSVFVLLSLFIWKLLQKIKREVIQNVIHHTNEQ